MSIEYCLHCSNGRAGCRWCSSSNSCGTVSIVVMAEQAADGVPAVTVVVLSPLLVEDALPEYTKEGRKKEFTA